MNPNTRFDLPVLNDSKEEYLCPGESHSISRSLHLARLAAGYTACRNCQHRDETGLLPRHVVKQTRTRGQRTADSIISADGIRGLYVNQLTRERMAQITQHILEILDTDRTLSQAADSGPLRILTGYDSRSMSPDLAIGLVSALRSWGCEIADVGHTSRPAFDFAFNRLRPHAALFLTGGLRPHAWSGLDVLDEAGLPWSLPGHLEPLHQRLFAVPNRISRKPGRYTGYRFRSDYEAILTQQFHAIRPLRIAICCVDPLVRNLLKQQLEQTPCSVHFLNVNANHSAPGERNGKSLIESLCERRLDVGFLIGADGRACRVYDEGGYELTTPEMLSLLTLSLSGPSSPVCVLQSNQPESVMLSPQQTDSVRVISGTERDLLEDQRQAQSPIAIDAEHRCWFRDEIPACDAIQTLAKLLEVLSLSERPLSSYRTSYRTARKRPLTSHL